VNGRRDKGRTGDENGGRDVHTRHRSGGGWLVPAAVAVARRPWLWPVAARQVLRLARPGWWRRWPPVPVPDPSYQRFRLQTAYGDPERAPSADDVVAYLEWCRGFGRLR
jgi:hypothetical protein